MKDESKTKRQLIQELIELRQQIVKLEKAEAKRKQIEDALRESEKRYREVVESAAEIIHTTDIQGNFTFANAASLKATAISLEEFKKLNYLDIIHPDHRQRLAEIYINQFRERKATIYVEFPILSRSGEVIWLGQNSSLMFEGEKVVGFHSVVRDITERKQMEETLRRSEEEAKRLAQENALVAEIGRIIGSTPNIDEVFERFSKAVAKLVPFDRVVINLRGPQEDDSFVRYVAGIDVPTRRAGEYVPLAGTATAECMRTKSSLLIQPKDLKEIEEWVARFPKFLPNFEAGIRSAILVPLIAEDRVIGVLSLRTTKTEAYTDQDMRLAESIAFQIAGAVANAQLYIERTQAEEAARRSEEVARRLAQENATVAEIGRIISSTLDIEEVYEGFAEEVRKLIPFDRISVNAINDIEDRTFTILYVWGKRVTDRIAGAVIPLAGSGTEEVMRTRSSVLVREENLQATISRCPTLLAVIQAGHRSIMMVPMISKNEAIGALNIQSARPNAYSERDLSIAERVGNQIAGAIANAQLYLERKQAEETLRKSEEEAKRLAQENALVAEIGRIISSTLDIDEIYGRFAQEVKKLIEFDRISINHINPKENTSIILFTWGTTVSGRQSREFFLLAGSATGEVLKARASLIIQSDDEKDIATRLPTFLPVLQAGLRSTMAVPLISKGEMIAALFFYSKRPKAYTDQDLKLAESIGYQIAGAIANAQLFLEHKRVEVEREQLIRDLQKALSEVKKLSGFLPICASCKKIRDDKGYWNQVEVYIRDHSEAEFSHGICPDCKKKLYGDFLKEEDI